MKNNYGLITGASSGLGKDFAYQLASLGYNLILVGRREELLNYIKVDIENKYSVDVVYKIVELSKAEELLSFVKEIKDSYEVEFLVNNAGYGGEAPFIDNSLDNNIRMIDVHINATVKLSYEFGNLMKSRNRGFIVNVSSLASYTNTVGASMYCSTKAFVRSFTETLALELKQYNIKVQALCPGFARTDFHEKLNMKEEKLQNQGIVRWMKSSDVVKASIKSIRNSNKIVVIPGFLNRFIMNLTKFIPKPLYYKLMIIAGKWN